MQSHSASFRTELELRRLASEVSGLRSELKSARPPSSSLTSILSNPTWLAVLGALVSVGTGIWQLHANRQLEREKLRSTLIQEASKSGSPETTLKNLKFLVKAGLVEDERGAIEALRLDDAPSFALVPSAPFSRQEMLDTFGDPKLRARTGDDVLSGLAVPDEGWVRDNLVEVDLPELVGVQGFPRSGRIKLHRLAAPHLKAAVTELSQLGLTKRILTFDGAWSPRYMAGNQNLYSAHAFGIAFDINARWNGLGRPPPAGQEGSVAELVPILERHGFYWGGHFARPDNNHFQYGIKTASIKLAASAADVGKR